MSKGPGKIERAILQAIEKGKENRYCQPALRLSNWNIAQDHFRDRSGRYQMDWEPSRTQLQSVTRAMHSFVRKHQQYALAGGKGRKRVYLYEPDDQRSAILIKLTLERRDFVPVMEVDRWLRQSATRG